MWQWLRLRRPCNTTCHEPYLVSSNYSLWTRTSCPPQRVCPVPHETLAVDACSSLVTSKILCPQQILVSPSTTSLGVSISRPSDYGVLKFSNTVYAYFNFLSFPICRIWPNHCNLLALIHLSRSSMCVSFDTSTCCDLPEITLNVWEFAPFI